MLVSYRDCISGAFGRAVLALLVCLLTLAPAMAQEKKPEPGKLSAEEQALLKCASADELSLIQSLQRSIEDFQQRMDTLEKPYMDANDAASDAQAHAEELGQDGSTATKEERDAAWSKVFRLRREAEKLWRDVKNDDAALEANQASADKDLRAAIDRIRARGCPPPAPGQSVAPGPVQSGQFVMPVLPECFEDEKARQAFDDKVYQLFLEQIDLSELASKPETRAAAHDNVDKLAELRGKIFLVPLCEFKALNESLHKHSTGGGKGTNKTPKKKKHGKHAITEDSPAYMENYQVPTHSHSVSHERSGDESVPSYPPPNGDSGNRAPQRPDLPAPPSEVPGSGPTPP